MTRSDTAVPVTRASRVRLLTGTVLRGVGRNSSTPLLAVVCSTLATFWFLLRDTAFISPNNLLNVVQANAPVCVMAVATVFVISAGEIDLSFASVIPLAAYVAALLLRWDQALIVAVLGGLGVGACVGLINGLITVGLRMPSFIVTLGMIGVAQGASQWITRTQAVPVVDTAFATVFGAGSLGPVPVLAFWTVAVGALGYVLLNRVPFGKAVLATGGNPTAAGYSGIRVSRVKVTVLVMSGLSGALAGLLYAGRLQGARYDLGADDLLTTLAAVIIGGTALSGGRGRVIGAIFGALLMGFLNNGLILLGLDVPQQLMFRGAIIVIAVALSARGSVRR